MWALVPVICMSAVETELMLGDDTFLASTGSPLRINPASGAAEIAGTLTVLDSGSPNLKLDDGNGRILEMRSGNTGAQNPYVGTTYGASLQLGANNVASLTLDANGGAEVKDSLTAANGMFEVRPFQLNNRVKEAQCEAVLRVHIDAWSTVHELDFNFFAKRTITTGKHAQSHVSYKIVAAHWCSSAYNGGCVGANRISINEVTKDVSFGGGLALTNAKTVTYAGEDYFDIVLCAGNNGTGGKTQENKGIVRISSSGPTSNVRLEALPESDATA